MLASAAPAGGTRAATARRPPGAAGDAAEVAAAADLARRRDPDGDRRVRRRQLRAAPRADGVRVLTLRGAGRRRAGRRGDARPPRADPRPGRADTVLMRALPGWIAKGGAEGLLCAAGPDGTRRRAEGRGRRARAPSARRSRRSSAGSAIRSTELDVGAGREQPWRGRRRDSSRLTRSKNLLCAFLRTDVYSGGRRGAGGGAPALSRVQVSIPSQHGESRGPIAHGRHRAPRRRGTPQARPGRTGKGVPHLRRDRRRRSRRSSSPRSRSKTSTPT